MPIDKPRIRRVRFYRTPAGNAVAREEFKSLPEAGQAALADIMTRFEHGDEKPGEIDTLGRGILEFRASVGRDQFRAYFFRDGPKYVIVAVCIQKKQQQAPSDATTLARARRKAWLAAARDAPTRPGEPDPRPTRS